MDTVEHRSNTIAVLQARVSSSRLKGKVLLPLLGKPMIARQIERIQRSRLIDKLIVATSSNQDDDELVDLCEKLNVNVYRGSLADVLDRCYQACAPFHPRDVVRLTGDCPLTDPDLIDDVIRFHKQGNFDYSSNVIEPTFPDGLDVEVCRFSTLEEAWKKSSETIDREHVTYYVHQRPQIFKLGSFKQSLNQSGGRWTVDEQDDYRFVKAVYEGLYEVNPKFSRFDVEQFLKENLMLEQINSQIGRNEGLEKSIQEQKLNKKNESRITKSFELQQRAKKIIPGLSQLLSKRPDQFSFGVWPGYFSRAKGASVWDLDGNHYIDMSIGGIGANVLGYADDEVDQAVIRAIADGTSSSLNCPEEVELAETLCSLHPWANKVRFARTGGEAMAIAVRIARTSTGRDKIAFCGYHGWHDWYLAANVGTENALGEHLLPGLSPRGVPKALAGTAFPFRYNQLNELEDILLNHGQSIAAVVMEPIRNFFPDPEFFSGVKKLSQKYNCVFILDEISSGFRMNTGGAHLPLGVTPDIAVFSKALGNGYPIAAVIGNDVMDAAQKTFISSTNWTERVGPVAALATLRKHGRLRAGDHLMRIGQAVQDGWKKLSERHNLSLSIGGIPPLSHFGFETENPQEMKAFFVQEMLKEGFLASTSFYSMFAHDDSHVEKYMAAADRVFADIYRLNRSGELTSSLEGQASVAGFKRIT